ncbi:AlkZ-related protein [Synoicihabitans lomoniglobus]|uniref:Uncharacterized protein n=1 Tax=Synoicihabitans lomoniglobus TaxID=2909285 RepID=A0AAE9ZVD4_9BACT|nr:hypothetical protein [Opitutaceae bacterium LMO-M01]WED63520.1 hypothetical protein PXH66_14375 [Opitutaceae bacterium LMO-M01]
MSTPTVKTLEQAFEFVQRVKLCHIFTDNKGVAPSLWDATDLPEKQPGESGWGQKVQAVWRWKNELPSTYPDEIFYGKIKGGKAVLMSMEHLRTEHYPQHHVPVEKCSPLARQVYDLIRVEPLKTGDLRKEITSGDKSRKTAFDKALAELQITLNIVRSNDPANENDTWLRLAEQYPEFG